MTWPVGVCMCNGTQNSQFGMHLSFGVTAHFWYSRENQTNEENTVCHLFEKM